MGDVVVRWDSWGSVRDALHDKNGMVVVCFSRLWDPPAYHTAQCLEALRMKNEVQAAQIFIVQLDDEPEAAFDLGIVTAPTVVCYFKGQLLSFQRENREDDTKIVGPASMDQWLDMVRTAKYTAEHAEGEKTISAVYVPF